MKSQRGSISLFMLVALLFYTGFLILLYASNVNKVQTVTEQFNAIMDIYAYNGGEEGAYEKAYTDLRKKNKQIITASSENSATLELTKTFNENISNYRIYGNSVQNGTPTPDNPVEVQSVGDLTVNLFNPNQQPEKIRSYLGINTSGINKNYTLQIKLKEGKSIPQGVYFGFVYYKEETSIGANASWLISNGSLNSKYGDQATYALTTFNPNDYYKTGICCYSGTQENWNNIVDAFDIVLIEGIYNVDNIPEYEPYGYKIPVKLTNENGESETTNIYLDEPLRKIGDYADYIDFKNGKIVRNVGKIIYDGTENWDGPVSAYSGYYLKNDLFKDEQIVLCNIAEGKLTNLTSISVRKSYNAIRMQGFSIPYDTLESFKQFLSTTNAVIIGGLSTPTEETISLPQLTSFEDYTKIEVSTSITPSKIEAEYMGYTLE